jgi:ankyrin repeat protein
LIEKLLTKGADMNMANKAGVTPLSLANSMANEKISNFMKNWKK